MHHLHGQPLPQNSFLQIKQVHILSKVKASKFTCPQNSNTDECGMGGKFSAVSAENAPPPQNTTYEKTGNSCTRKSWEQTLLTIPRLTLTITINAKPCYNILVLFTFRYIRVGGIMLSVFVNDKLVPFVQVGLFLLHQFALFEVTTLESNHTGDVKNKTVKLQMPSWSKT